MTSGAIPRSPSSVSVSPAECAKRLSAAVESESAGYGRCYLDNAAPVKPVIGTVDGISLEIRKWIAGRNSCQVHLTAKLQPAGTGTAMIGSVGMNAHARVFISVWIGGIAFTVLIALLYFLAHSNVYRAEEIWGILRMPMLMLGVGIVILVGGRFSARHEADYLTEYVACTLHATPPPEA